jgi:hypothetical protein
MEIENKNFFHKSGRNPADSPNAISLENVVDKNVCVVHDKLLVYLLV